MNSSRAKSVALALAALLPVCGGAPAIASALSVGGVTLPTPPLPKVEVHSPLPVEAHTPLGSVTPSPSSGVTVSVPSPTPAVPPVETSVNTGPPPSAEAPSPPVKVTTVPSVPEAAAPPPGGSAATAPAAGSPAGQPAGRVVDGVAQRAGGLSIRQSSQAAAARATTPRSGRTRRSSTASAGQRGQPPSPSARSAKPSPAAGAAAAATTPAGHAGASDPAHPHSNSSGGGPFATIGRQIPFPVPVPDWSKPVIVLLLLLALGLGLRSVVASRRARRLEQQREGLLQDIDALQAALVPDIPRQVEGLAVSVAYRPAEGPAAGGDFYDVFSLSSGKVAVILGDVAGHGHEALRHAALIRFTLRAYLQAGLEPRAALALAGRALEQPIGENCATVAVGIYDRRGSRLTYTLAGHPPPILRGVDAPEPLTICSSPPIGWSLPTGRRQSVVALPPGSEVCFFSDGLIEARADGGFVGRDGLRAILAELGSRAQAAALLEQVQARTHATPDDMAACILAPRTAVRPEPLHIEELEVGTEEIEKGAAQRFLDACAVLSARIENTIALAESILASSETVLLRVESSARGLEVSAHAPSGGPHAAAEVGTDGGPGGARSGQRPAPAPRRDPASPARRAVDVDVDIARADEGPALLL